MAYDLKCTHCGLRAGKRRTGERSTDECFDLLRHMARLRTREVTIIGGSLLSYQLKLTSPEALCGRIVNHQSVAAARENNSPPRRSAPAGWIAEIEEMREQLIVNINRKAATDALFLTMAASSASDLPPKRRFLIK